ncbi:MAG: tyrosine-type recombinase/integrase [Acidimicrobiales bacterium]
METEVDSMHGAYPGAYLRPVDPSRGQTVDQIVEDYLQFLEHDGRKHSTLLRYRTVYARWLAPAVGSHPADLVPPGGLERALEAMRDAGQSRSSIHQAFTLLSGAFRWAASTGRLPDDPMVGVDEPPSTRATGAAEPPAAGDVLALIAAALDYDHEFGVACRLAAVAGMRRGEIAGLSWRCVDLERRRVGVELTVNDAGGHVTTTDLQATSRARILAIDDRTAALLTEHRHRMDERAGLCGVDMVPDAFVFSHSPDGSTPIAPNYLTRSTRQLRKNVGLGGADFDSTLHSLNVLTRRD